MSKFNQKPWKENKIYKKRATKLRLNDNKISSSERANQQTEKWKPGNFHMLKKIRWEIFQA